MARALPDPRVVARVAGSALLTLAAVVGVIAVLAVAAGAVFGIRPVVVVSGSMEPVLPVGSMVFVRTVPADTVHVGDIVTTERSDGVKELITHRVVSATTSGDKTVLRLRGDANAAEDPFPYTVSSVGGYVFDVPWVGTISLVARTPLGLAAIGLYALTLVLLILFGRTRRAASPPPSARHRGAEAA